MITDNIALVAGLAIGLMACLGVAAGLSPYLRGPQPHRAIEPVARVFSAEELAAIATYRAELGHDTENVYADILRWQGAYDELFDKLGGQVPAELIKELFVVLRIGEGATR